MGEIPDGSCTALEILLKHLEHTLFQIFNGNGNSDAGMFVDKWWAFIVFSLNLLYWGMFSYTSYQKIFLYNLSPTSDNVVPCRNTNCTFMMQVYVLY
jgi:hypothetical protein